jgi:hypothetical protein
MHMASGLFVNAGYGKGNGAVIMGIPGSDHSMWHLQGGLEKNVFGFGSLTLMGEYAKLNIGDPCTATPPTLTCPTPAIGPVIDGTKATMYGLSAIQAIDSAATDLYLSWRHYDIGDIGQFPNDTNTGNTFIAGARVKF